MVRVMNLINLDIIEVEPILTVIFGEFRETDAFNDHFKEMGYESSTFFLSLGVIMVTLMVFLVWMPIRKLLQRIVRFCPDNWLTIRLKSRPFLMQTVLLYFFETCIELSLSALICISKMTGENFGSFSEGFSTVCAFICVAICIFTPVYMFVVKKRYISEIQAKVENSKYESIF